MAFPNFISLFEVFRPLFLGDDKRQEDAKDPSHFPMVSSLFSAIFDSSFAMSFAEEATCSLITFDSLFQFKRALSFNHFLLLGDLSFEGVARVSVVLTLSSFWIFGFYKSSLINSSSRLNHLPLFLFVYLTLNANQESPIKF